MPRTKQITCWAMSLGLAAWASFAQAQSDANSYSGAPRPLPQYAARPIESAPAPWPQNSSGARPLDNPRPLDSPRPLPERFASAEVSAPAGGDVGPRPLGSPSGRPLVLERGAADMAKTLEGKLPKWASGAASVGIVAGLFVLVLWTARRSANGGPCRLPREAVEVLGRAPLAGRQQVHLVRCGHKLLLVSITPTATETLTEIVDPAEVERLEQLCRQPGLASNPVRDLWARFAGGARRQDYFQQQTVDELDFDHLGGGHAHGKGLFGAHERRQESQA